jgi:putative ABC transport system substrate-binding protein
MRRRHFIVILGGALSLRPHPLQAQPTGGLRRIGALFGVGKDAATEANFAAFREALLGSGWAEGRDILIEGRWGDGTAERARALAAELISLKPHVILTSGIRALNEERQQEQSIPVVFVATTDPVAQGFAQSFQRPGGQTTGFLLFEFSVLRKLLDGLREIVPSARRVGLFINPENRSTGLHAEAFESAARSMGLSPSVISVRDPAQIEPAIAAFAAEAKGALILPPDVFMLVHRELIAQVAGRHGVPLVAAQREFTDAGGLMSYGVEEKALFRQAASYVDRILRGMPPGELPIQAPTTFSLVINLNTARALGIAIPPLLLARADHVVE